MVASLSASQFAPIAQATRGGRTPMPCPSARPPSGSSGMARLRSRWASQVGSRSVKTGTDRAAERPEASPRTRRSARLSPSPALVAQWIEHRSCHVRSIADAGINVSFAYLATRIDL
jgi:hypothetical protein